MSLTAGALAKIAVASTTDTVSATAATSGSTPYTYQLYRSTVSGFVPSSTNAVAGATSLSTNDTGLAPGTTYYYKQVAIDAASASVTTAQLQVVTAPAQSQNQFLPTPIIGMIDHRFNFNTEPVVIDVSETATTDQAGTFVKLVTTSTGVPKVIACTANSDVAYGVINYDIKSATFLPGDRCEISKGGNVVYLISVGAINAGAQVQLDLTYTGGVKTSTGSSGAQYVGVALDSTTGDGQLLRVELKTPTFTTF